MEIVEVANKELKVETRLRNIETRWNEEQLGFTRHRDTEVCLGYPTSTPRVWRRSQNNQRFGCSLYLQGCVCHRWFRQGS